MGPTCGRATALAAAELEDAPEVVSRMRHVLLLLEDPRELLKRDAFAIRVRLRTLWGSGGAFVWGVTSRGHVDRRGSGRYLVALDRLLHSLQPLVAPCHRAPHPRIVRPQPGRLPVVEKRVIRHLQDLVRLPEPVPVTADAARLIEQAYTPRGAEFDGLSSCHAR